VRDGGQRVSREFERLQRVLCEPRDQRRLPSARDFEQPPELYCLAALISERERVVEAVHPGCQGHALRAENPMIELAPFEVALKAGDADLVPLRSRGMFSSRVSSPLVIRLLLLPLRRFSLPPGFASPFS
jgi:hypothetical protein